MTVTVLLQYREHTAFLQHAEDLAPGTGDDEVAAFFTRELNEFFQCADCGKTTCWNGESETICEWCGNSAETAAEEKFDSITGGGF